MIDCMIASVAWRRGAALLAADPDLSRVADVIGIAMDPGSTRA
jgi:predicted nucleic acid-binding protein